MPARKSIDELHWIAFVNRSGLTIPAFGCFVADSWDGPTEDTVKDGRGEMIVAAQPSEYGAQHSHYLNGPVAIRAGAAGVCAQPWAFPMLARVSRGGAEPGAPASANQELGPVPGSFELRANVGGFRLVRRRSSDLCLVLMSPFVSLVGRTADAIAKGASGAVTIYEGRDLLSLAATSYTAQAVNLFADLPADAMVFASRKMNQWVITAAECTIEE